MLALCTRAICAMAVALVCAPAAASAADPWPTAPTGLAATAGDRSVTLSWGPSTDDVAVVDYRIFQDGAPVARTTARSFTAGSLVNGQRYAFSVRAFDGWWYSNNSDVVSATPVGGDTTPPAAPMSLRAAPGDGEIALTWNAATDNVGVSGYRIYRDGALAGSATTPSFTATGLVNGTTYGFTVKAFDAAYNMSAASTALAAAPRSSGAVRPYDARSPWNTPIPGGVGIDPLSASYVNAIADNGVALTSSPDEYSTPVYYVDGLTPRRTIALYGYFGSYDAGDDSRVGYGWAPTLTNIPIPDAARQSEGSDGQVVFWDATTGTEYSFYQFDEDASGNFIATNGVRYHTTSGYFGRFADGRAGRGAGLPYLAGLVRKWEIDQGRIDHALAFAYDAPSPSFVYPASKSDGLGLLGRELPEGSRLQLDPSLTDAQLSAWGLSAPAKVMARAMQRYGMYLVDHAGSSKVFLEDRSTAGWGPDIHRGLLSNIPWSAFRVVAPPAAP